jgi:hypothetical protein
MVARLGGCKTEQRTKASSSTKAVGTAYALRPESKGATTAIKNGLGTCSVDGTAAYTGRLAVVHSIVLTSPFCSPSSEQYPILHVPAPPWWASIFDLAWCGPWLQWLEWIHGTESLESPGTAQVPVQLS